MDARAAMFMLLAVLATILLLDDTVVLAVIALMLFGGALLTQTLPLLLRRVRYLLPGSLLIGVFVLFAAPHADGTAANISGTLSAAHLTAAALVAGRIFIVGTASLLFILCVPVERMIAALQRLHFPDTAVTLIWLSSRFLTQLERDARGSLQAMTVRGAAASLPRRLMAGARLSGTFLLRAVGKSEQMSDVLSARGFRGSLPPQHVSDDLPTWQLRDSALLCAIMGVLTALWILR